ncbi:MAG: histidinol-phosphate transaminase [Gammaproteobacteria bacterium]|nr:histidinol-phosphate transaminase [Gammaproteobacteria bacterium]
MREIENNNNGSPTAWCNEAESLVSRWVRPEIRKIKAYHVPDSGNLIKLDAMENPYQWPIALLDAWTARLRDSKINRYPDPSAENVKLKLRAALKVPDNLQILLGNGSDEIIQMIAMLMAEPGRAILTPEPGFVMYKMIATMVGMQYVGVSLQQDFELDIDAMFEAIERYTPAVIFIAYPNNPTGNLFEVSHIEEIIKASRGLIVVDEAYHAFAGSSLMDKLDKYHNLLVMRTVSKMGLAGLRLGYLVGSSVWLSEIDKMRLPYNINVLTQLSAEFALEHMPVFEMQTQQICVDRETLYQSMVLLSNVQVFPSSANFLLFRVEGKCSTDIFQQLKDHRILIKNMGSQNSLLQNCLRVTVGTTQENTAFLTALKAVI